MIAKQEQARLLFAFIALLVTLSLTIVGCVAKPQPTFVLEVTCGEEKQVQVGQKVAIIAKIQPPEELTLKWSVDGDAEGTLNTYEGEEVIYVGNREGIDFVTTEGTTASGTPVKEKVALTVVGEPVAEVPTPTDTPVPPTPALVPTTETPATQPPDETPTLMPDTVTLIYPQDGQSVPCENLAKGMYSSDITNPIWPVVYIGGRFHPQDEGGGAPPMVNSMWYGTVRFGDCFKPPDYDRGRPFQLIIVTADEQANQAFEAYLAACRSTGEYPGMVSLPEGVKEYLRIVVTRQ